MSLTAKVNANYKFKHTETNRHLTPRAYVDQRIYSEINLVVEFSNGKNSRDF